MILYNESEVTRKLPLNFKEDDLDLFARELNRKIHETSLHKLRNVVASGDGFLFQNKRILPENFTDGKASRKKDLVKAYLRKIKIGLNKNIIDLHNPALWFTDQWSHMYFHWIMDALPRLFVAKDYLGNRKILLPERFQRMGFVRESLHAFGIEDSLYFLPKEKVIRVDDLLIPSQTAPTGNYNLEIVQALRTFYYQYYEGQVDIDLGDKIYVSRAKAKWRKVVNEEEVMNLLSKYGFQIIFYEDCSWAEKVAIGHKAKYLVSLHGAGLTNKLFMNDKSSLFEFRLAGDSANNAFFSMASALNIHYLYQICEGDEKDVHKANVHIDLYQLEKNIELMLANEPQPTIQELNH